MFEVKHLRVLREVSERGSFSAAAEALGYTQPAISQQVAALERKAGMKLLNRTPRGIWLTDAGRVLLDHAEAILARMGEAEADLEALAGLRGGRVRLTSFPTAGASLIPPAVAAFRDRHPSVEVELSVSGPTDAIDRLRRAEVDLAVLLESGFEPQRDDDRIERIRLLDDPLFAALPAGHPLARKRHLKLAELADEAWIEDDSSCPDAAIFLRACHAAGFEPRVALHNDDYSAIQGFIAAGVGVALIPQLALQSVRDDVAIRPLAEPTPVRRVVAATLADGHRSPATRPMLDILESISADYLPRGQSQLAPAA